LAARYRNLEALPLGSLGHSFWQWYDRHGFAFPGEADALNEAFAVPHDSTHILSGYSTTYRGEILVSTFTAGMHPEEPMAGHILPVIFSWHLGVELIEHAGAHKGALDPEAFWQAWRRGQDTAGDVFAQDWDFWAVAETPVAVLQERYGVPALEA
jgi:ubiquinone biosynthesis protein Coq4